MGHLMDPLFLFITHTHTHTHARTHAHTNTHTHLTSYGVFELDCTKPDLEHFRDILKYYSVFRFKLSRSIILWLPAETLTHEYSIVAVCKTQIE